METETPTCTGCKHAMVPSSHWRKADAGQRSDMFNRGIRRHEGRGMCVACYARAKRSGRLIDAPRKNWTQAELLEEWQHLQAKGTPLRHQVENAAARLGKSPKGLESALRRAGITSEYALGGKTRKDGCTA